MYFKLLVIYCILNISREKKESSNENGEKKNFHYLFLKKYNVILKDFVFLLQEKKVKISYLYYLKLNFHFFYY